MNPEMRKVIKSLVHASMNLNWNDFEVIRSAIYGMAEVSENITKEDVNTIYVECWNEI